MISLDKSRVLISNPRSREILLDIACDDKGEADALARNLRIALCEFCSIFYPEWDRTNNPENPKDKFRFTVALHTAISGTQGCDAEGPVRVSPGYEKILDLAPRDDGTNPDPVYLGRTK